MSLCRLLVLTLAIAAGFLSPSRSGLAGDWPTWRYDARRSAAAPDELPPALRRHWSRALPRLRPAWPDQSKMQFDAAYEPVVAGQRLFLSSSFDNSVTCYDTRTGAERWRYFTDGPVRFAPLAWQERVYAVSDDGHLYCLAADDGKLLWRFRGGPGEQLILGNERLISMWPARGAPVIADGTVYFAAGIWPFMGIFLHALDAQTGEVIWTNDGDGSIYIKQPHQSDSFAGVAPQGALVVSGDRLLVPGGRSVPACYDRRTGKLLYYELADNGKRGGGSTVAADERFMFNGGAAFELASEHYLGAIGEIFAFADETLYDWRDQQLRAIDLRATTLTTQPSLDRKGQAVQSLKWTAPKRGFASAEPATALIRAGSRLYAGSAARIQAFSLPLSAENGQQPAWELPVQGTPASLVAADNRLFVVTAEGELICFGDSADAQPEQAWPLKKAELPRVAGGNETPFRAAPILSATGVSGGYAVLWGLASDTLLFDLLQSTELRIIVLEPEPTRVGKLREQLRGAGIGSERVTVLQADPLQVQLPPYLASLSIADGTGIPEPDRARWLAKVFANLRPYGGVACLATSPAATSGWPRQLPGVGEQELAWKTAGPLTLLVRPGALPDSADWNHEHADAANTRVSRDGRVKTPLGLLWFGGPSNDAILPRHGHGPQPQVVDGRLFIEGMDLLRAIDIYTGRLLWEASLPGLGKLYDNTAHQPGANASGTNYVAMPDGVYVAYGQRCVQLDPATGKPQKEFSLPPLEGSTETPTWGFIAVADRYLIGGAEPLFDPALGNSRGDNDNYSSSRRLVVLDRTSGRVLWTAAATNGFRHNAICVGGGRIYCIDRLSGAQLSRLKRRGEQPSDPPRLLAFDLATGQRLWHTDTNVFGTWLSYSAERDLLVEAGRMARDTLSDEPRGMRTYEAENGTVVWENPDFAGPAMIHHDTILMSGTACDLRTGKPKMREHPLSGEPVEWNWSRNYGCNTPLASEHLLTFRSGAAGYFDYCNDGGTGNFGGFRSSCSNNLIVAGGLLNAPDYTRTCNCSYQNQTSLALIHMPEVETWTSFGAQTPKQVVRRVGINLGAPGDRKADDGTLWLEYPSLGGASPAVKIETQPTEPEWFRRHSAVIRGDGLTWVASSGARGLQSLRLGLASSAENPRSYRVRLHFTEPDEVQAGDRVFDVHLQGERVLAGLDIHQVAGGRHRPLVQEFSGIQIGDHLLIELTPTPQAKISQPVLCGIEVISEGW